MTRPFGMPETPKGRKGWKQNSNGKPNNWALNWSPSNSRLHNDPIQRGGVPWKPQAITLKCPAQGQMSVMAISQQLTGVEAERDMMLATNRKMQSERTTP